MLKHSELAQEKSSFWKLEVRSMGEKNIATGNVCSVSLNEETFENSENSLQNFSGTISKKTLNFRGFLLVKYLKLYCSLTSLLFSKIDPINFRGIGTCKSAFTVEFSIFPFHQHNYFVHTFSPMYVPLPSIFPSFQSRYIRLRLFPLFILTVPFLFIVFIVTFKKRHHLSNVYTLRSFALVIFEAFLRI